MNFHATRYPDKTASADSGFSFKHIVSRRKLYLAFSLVSKSILLLLFIQMATGCRHIASNEIQPSLAAPAEFSQSWKNTLPKSSWWETFQDPILNELIEKAFKSSFTLKQAFARIMQARLAAGQSASELYPEVTGVVSAGSDWFTDGKEQKNYRAKINISWEVDNERKLMGYA